MPPRARWRAVAAGWALVVLIGGVLPTQGAIHAVSGGRDDLLTTAGHFAAYVLLGFLLAVALGGWEAGTRDLLWAFALGAGLGVVIELVQGPLPYRDAQVLDAVVDAGGAALGLLVLSAVARVQRRRSRRG